MEETRKNIKELELETTKPGFWQNKQRARDIIKEISALKNKSDGRDKYDKSDAIITILSGAGGDDAEDFSRILVDMYRKYIEIKGWPYSVIHKNENDHSGYRNITIEIRGRNAYGILKNESGVHRLVRISPFNAKKLRHTSFSMVEVVPRFEKTGEIAIPDNELKVEFSKSSKPGGQNVNKRETAVRIVHLPTNISAHANNERSQIQNKEKAMEILKGKIYCFREEERKKKEQGLYVSKTMEIEWGHQIRSYVLHPYKMVKDHRTGAETADIDSVLSGKIDKFLEAEKNL